MRTGRALAAIAVLAVASSARADDVFDLFGLGPRAVAMSGAMTAEASDYSAAFYNPALLVGGEKVKLGLGGTFEGSQMTVLSRNPSKTLDCSRCYPTRMGGVIAGAMFPLGGKLDYRVALGFAAHLPTVGLTHVRAADPSRPYWGRYYNDPDRMTIFAGAGVQVLDTLSLGLGVQFHGGLTGNGLNAEIDPVAQQIKLREIDSYLSSDLAPTAGVFFEPDPTLRLGFSYRHEFSMGYSVPASMDLGLMTMKMDISGRIHFTPHTFTLGAAWDATDAWTLSLDIQYAEWHRMPSPYMTFNLDLGGDLLDALGLGSALDMFAPVSNPHYVDTLGWKVGTEYRVSPDFAIRGGAFYRPTPVPQQNASGSNIMDANAIGISAGVEVSFKEPLEIFPQKLHVGLAGQLTFELPRAAVKSDSDPMPSYDFNGTVLNVQGDVRYEF